MYKIAQNGVIRTSDGALIPNDSSNSDNIKYVLWQSQGNTAEPLTADTRAQWNARAQEKARVTINQAREAVAKMITKRPDADAAIGSLRTLQAQLLALIPSVNLSATTDETNAFNTIWAAYVPLVAAFPAPIRAEYKLEFEALTKVIV
jgi:hypothetical protein